ncbi:hypothetical protein COCON_G00139450 [Conger conger]|uniref:Uncharacterized protein n=1 Tax=Conger conger TaxID=82655 RepID=A0A9Q1HVK2_CONCO|nr:hypothetical protein COCON_G00139450 [Conger conger]
MSLPPIAVPKSAAAAGTGPGPGPSPSSQLRATLTSVALPGAPVTPQAPAAPPPQIPRIPPPLEDRIFPTQPGVAAVYSQQLSHNWELCPSVWVRDARECLQWDTPAPLLLLLVCFPAPGPPYSTHDITKGHPSLAGTPPGHGSTPGLSQVSVSTAHLYRYLKSCESGRGSPYPSGQNAAQLVYSPPTQPMNAQPQSRPFAAGPRASHHQFFQRTQMQQVRPTIPSNSPSIRPGSQTPTAAVYPPPNQPIMMTMTPMPFPSPQAAQYYIPQYRHSTPQYVGPPQQYSVQPPGPNTFYPTPPGEFPTPYAGPPYYPGQAVYTPSPPIIVPTPQQPPPTKREKKTIRIRDPNQGGRDITEEIMSGGGTGSRNPTPPVGRPSSTPTPAEPGRLPRQCGNVDNTQLGSHTPDHGPVGYSVDSTPHLSTSAVDVKPDEKPKQDPAPALKPPSPGLQPLDPPAEKSDPAPPEKPPEPPFPAPAAPPSTGPSPPAPAVSPAQPPPPEEPAPTPKDEPKLPPLTPPQPQSSDSERPPPELPHGPPAAPTPPPPLLKAINGLTDKDEASLSRELEAPPPESARPPSPPPSQPVAPPLAGGDAWRRSSGRGAAAEALPRAGVEGAPVSRRRRRGDAPGQQRRPAAPPQSQKKPSFSSSRFTCTKDLEKAKRRSPRGGGPGQGETGPAGG